MIEVLVSVLELILSALDKLKSSDKKRVARALTGIYVDVIELAENGSTILTLMESLISKGTIGGNIVSEEYDGEPVSQLRMLLTDQETRITKLKKALKKKRIGTMLSIKIPNLYPFMTQVIQEKGAVVAFLLEAIRPDNWEPADGDTFLTDLLPPSKIGLEDALIRIPYSDDIGQAQKNLKRLKTLSAKLRKFLASQFSVEDLA